MADFGKLPEGSTLDVQPFKAHVPEQKLQDLKKLLELSPLAPPVFENTSTGRRYGMERSWLETAKQAWLSAFDWRKVEDRMNSFPSFKATVKDKDGNDIELHFLALFSEKADAVPIAFFHGWPESNLGFMDMLDILRKKYTPQSLPYHIVVPALPGYAFSSGPPVDKDYGMDTAASALHELMVGLGFGSGYLVQGGDLGSFMCRIIAMSYDACKGMHVNMMGVPPLEQPPTNPLEKRALDRAVEALDTGLGFVYEQGTRAATVGFVLSASPLALLAWIGEKMLAWTDDDPPLDKILENVTLWWLTNTAPRTFYHNRSMGRPDETPKIARMISVIGNRTPITLPYIEKPSGYSNFHNEIVPVPKSWAEKSCNLVFFKHHERGGHFPAFEKPHELLADAEEFVKVAWK